MTKLDIAGLKIDTFTKQELLEAILKRIKNQQKTWVTTVYSEFLYAALRDQKIMEMLNQADLALPDGIGIFWAHKYLQIPLTAKTFFGKIIQALWQIIYSLAGIIFYPKWIYTAQNSANSRKQETIPGSNLIFDLAEMTAKNNLSIYLLGGFGDTSKLAANKLESYCLKNYKLKLTTYNSGKHPADPTIISDIQTANPDILLVAYGPIKQETWISQNKQNIPASLIIGLGGTFDYIAGKQPSPPQFIRSAGLEWLWRLITQPKRYKRIFNATFGLISALWHYKVFKSMPFRQNVVSIILDNQGKVLICKRNPLDPDNKLYGYSVENVTEHWQFPQGGMNKKEDFIDTAKRECKEEVGLINLKFIKLSQQKHTYDWPNANRRFFAVQYKMRGQEQQIVYFKNLDNNSLVKIDNKEFIDYKWINSDQLINIIHPQRKSLAEIVTKDLKEMAEKAII